VREHLVDIGAAVKVPLAGSHRRRLRPPAGGTVQNAVPAAAPPMKLFS
jgi:hypothetical protein